MFQLTPQYSKWLTLSFAPVISVILLNKISACDRGTAALAEFVADNVSGCCDIFFACHAHAAIPGAAPHSRCNMVFFSHRHDLLLALPLFAIATQTFISSERLKIMAGLIFILVLRCP